MDENLLQLDRDGDGVFRPDDLAVGEAIAILSMSGEYVDYEESRVATWGTTYSDRAARLTTDLRPDGTLALFLEMSVACNPTAAVEFAFVERRDGSFAIDSFRLEALDREVGTRDDVSSRGILVAEIGVDTISGQLAENGLDVGGPLYGLDLPRRPVVQEETGVAIHVDALAFRQLGVNP